MSEPFLPGSRIKNRYEVEKLIGTGRSARVYKCLDHETRRKCAVKVLDPFLVQDPIHIERFKREAEMLSTLNHKNIIKVNDLFESDGSQCISMEYFDGVNLKDFLTHSGPLGIGTFLKLATQLTAALESCHASRVLHRDIKPQNILVNENLDIRIVDFGISKMNTMSDLTKTGTFLGTPEYMAPETFRSSIPDPRLDVYGLGAVFYEMLACKSPFAGLSIQQVMARQAAGTLPPLAKKRSDIPEWLESIILKCLKTDPAQRYHSAFEITLDMERMENARALTEAQHNEICCWNCKENLMNAMPFCHACGMWINGWDEPGKNSIALYDVPNPQTLREHIENRLSIRLKTNWERELKNIPIVLLRGINDQAARSVYHTLGELPIKMQVVNNLSRQFKLPWKFIFSETVLMGPLIWNLVNQGQYFGSTTLSLIYFGFSQIPILWMFGRQTKALIPNRKKEKQVETPGIIFLEHVHGQLMGISSPRIRYLVISMARSLMLLTEKNLLSDLLTNTFHQAIEVAGHLSSLDRFLSSITINEFKERQRQLELKIRNCNNISKLDSLQVALSKIKVDIQHFLDSQKHFGDLYLSLINYGTLLKRIEEDATETSRNYEVECNRIQRELDIKMPILEIDS